MKITKNTIRKTLRTFFQAFFGTFMTASTAITWYEVDIKPALIGVLISSILAGLSALFMNLEEKEN